METRLNPVIKWSGSKRHLAKDIISHFPREIDTYYEPFLGGGSVMGAVIKSDIKVNKIIASDLNGDLIGTWKAIKEDPEKVIDRYSELWEEMKSLPSVTDKSSYFNSLRDKFNKERNPLDFFFIMRTCFNGMPRYNSLGNFNSPFHLNRDGIDPKRLSPIIEEWSSLIEKVEFRNCSYQEIKPLKGDYVFLDPPYENTKQMYFGNFDNKGLFTWLRGLECSYSLTYDGMRGSRDITSDVPQDLYNSHVYLDSGNSSFSRLNKSLVRVKESLYIFDK